ncbi:hypothetical protein AB8O64_35315 [Streptomyces sp. QH1-20]
MDELARPASSVADHIVGEREVPSVPAGLQVGIEQVQGGPVGRRIGSRID